MPIHLNFLLDEDRRKVKSAAVLSWVCNVLRCLLIVLIIFNGFLGLVFFLFHDQVEILDQLSSDSSQRYAFYDEQIQKINGQTGQLNLAGEKYRILTARFWSIINSVPQDIKISNIILDINDTTMNIPGVAQTRDALIAYDKYLLTLPWVEKTSLPKSQLLQKENVPFQIQITIKK